MIHDIQNGYRKVLDSISRPGDYVNLKNESKSLESVLMFLAVMLLDGEVSFSLVGNHSEELSKKIIQFTYSKIDDYKEADYIFIREDVSDIEKLKIIKDCKSGTLIDPQKSATLIIQVEDLKVGERVSLKGPGIRGSKEIVIPLSKAIINERRNKNIEFPLGVDLVIIDKKLDIISIPRTTEITIMEG